MERKNAGLLANVKCEQNSHVQTVENNYKEREYG